MIDTHAHINMCKDDSETVIKRAADAGVKRIINIAVDLESAQWGDAVSKSNKRVAATIGIHPLYHEKFGDLDAIASILNGQHNYVAMGEMGLDYKYDDVNKEAQHHVFRGQLDLARSHNMPIVIHNRQSDEDMISILNDYTDLRRVVHCFSSNWDFAKSVMTDDTYYSFTGIITYAKKGKVIDVVRQMPLSRIMIETDCPYLTPEAYRGVENEPAFVVEMAKRIAEIKELSLEEVIDVTTQNAEQFFNFGD
ncbi:MAG: TatD family hydrolase [bacterium]|nr:TatD family hydrolase [bacterium]